MNTLDQVRLNFTPESLVALNVVLGVIMLGVALDLRVEDFRRIIRAPKAPAVGLLAQFLLLPAATFGLVTVLEPAPSVALGMIVVGSCPGGNISNVVCWLAKGNVAVSVSMTAVSTAAAIVATPFNIALWGGLYPPTAALLASIEVPGGAVLITVALVLGVPLVLGMQIGARWPEFTHRVRKPFSRFSVLALFAFIGIAFAKNFDFFVDHISELAGYVALHNALALGLGYGLARLARLPRADRHAVAIEVGIQNSGLGLVLVFTFLDGLGGAAMIAAWWGVWHIVMGMTLAWWWGRGVPEDLGSV
jgi:BASS family bile acid:Na+ symporter